jgi:tripartite-type tricarboxylate transporter receptor subunit TctC
MPSLIHRTRLTQVSMRSAGAIVASLLTAASAFADSYPSRPVRIVAPIAAGGPSDTAARLVAIALGKQLKQNVIVENRTGAGGVVGTELALNAPADGYTLLLSIAATFTVIPAAKKVGYDVDNDFAALGQIWSAPQALVVNANSRFKSVADLVSFAKANPDKVTFGSAGIGTTTHLSIQLLQQGANIRVVHVPYRGTSHSVADVVSGNIDAVFGDISNLMPFIEAGKLSALATTGKERSSLLPNVPTMVEAGTPNVVTVNWYGLHVRSATPPAILSTLKAAVRAAQDDLDFKNALGKNATSTGTVGADAFEKMIQEERARLTPVVRSLGIN